MATDPQGVRETSMSNLPGTRVRSDRFVRQARREDAEGIAAIQADAMSRLAPHTPTTWAHDLAVRWARTLNAPAPAGHWTLVAVHGSWIAGFALVVPACALDVKDVHIDEGSEIAELLIDPNFVRAGHGSRLLQAIADLAAVPSLRTWVGAEDEARVRFLQSSGFAPSGLRRSLERPGVEPIVQHLWWAQLAH